MGCSTAGCVIQAVPWRTGGLFPVNFRQLGCHVQEGAKADGSRGSGIRPRFNFFGLVLILLGNPAQPYVTRVRRRSFRSKARHIQVKSVLNSGQRREFPRQRRIDQLIRARQQSKRPLESDRPSYCSVFKRRDLRTRGRLTVTISVPDLPSTFLVMPHSSRKPTRANCASAATIFSLNA